MITTAGQCSLPQLAIKDRPYYPWSSGALITMETENYQIDGKKGNWIATDTIIINGKQFYLMEHQVYRDQAQGVIPVSYTHLDVYKRQVLMYHRKKQNQEI